jgi:hypothetical protein
MSYVSNRILSLIVVFVSIPFYQNSWAAEPPISSAVAPIVKLNPKTTLIVLPNKPEQRVEYAGAVLRDYLRKATRVTEGFEIVPEISGKIKPAEQFIIAVGPTKWAEPSRTANLRLDSYSLLRSNGALAITGIGKDGPLFGVAAFLDKVVGIRFYIPGEQFTCMPEKPEISVGHIDIISEPYVASCFMSGIELNDPAARSWLTLNGGFRRKGGTHQHNMFAMFPPEKYADKYPEIYPIIAGKRHIPASPKDQAWQINFTEPRTLEIAEQSVLEFLKDNPDFAYATMSINDGYDVSQDEVTQAYIKAYQEKNPGKESRDRATSAMYWEFITKLGNRLLSSAPGKKLVCLAYALTRFPPEQKLPPNIVVFTNYHVAELPTEGIATPGKTPLEGWLEPWLKVTEHFGNHDWYQGSGYLLPRIYSGYWSVFLRALKTKVKDPYMHVECYPNWGLDGPKLWVLTRLWWDPSQDPDKLTQQFCDDMFGPGALPMAAYFRKLEDLWGQIDITDGPERKLNRWTSQFNSSPTSRKMIGEAREFLDQTLKTDMNEAQRSRVLFFSDCFGLTERFFALAAKTAVTEADLKEGEEYIEKKVLTYPLSLHHKHLTLPAWRELYWAKVKAAQQILSLPVTPAPKLGAMPIDKVWEKAVLAKSWLVKGAGEDPQKTSAQLLQDGSALHIRVTCPCKDVGKLIESDDDNWRSDNIELFFDLDGDKSTFERQMWVKTNGRIFDFSGKENPNRDIKAKVLKDKDNYIVEISVPFSYAKAGASANKIGIMMVRNEFQHVKGMNELIYTASWNGILDLSK